MSVAVTAKRDATRPELADPHILSMTGWLMAGWLAGQSVGRVGSRALPTGTCASRLFVPPRIRVLLASPPPPLVPSFTLIPARLTGACYSFSRMERRAGGIFSPWYSRPPSQPPPPPPIPRHGIESSRHGVRTEYGRRACETEGKKEREKKRTNGETARSGTEIARLTGNRVKGSKSEGARKKEREGQNRVGRRFPIAKRGPSRSDDDRKR